VATTPTLLTILQLLHQSLGPYATGTATSGSSLSLLECTAAPFKSTIASSSRYEGHYVWRPSAAAADRSRIVPSGGYSYSAGTLTPDLAWAVNPYSGGVGETFYVVGVVEPATDAVRMVNNGLKRCFVEDEFTIAVSSATATRFSLASAAAWLDDKDLVYQVGYLNTGEVRADTDPYRGRTVRGHVERLANVFYLNTGASFSTSTTLYAKCLRPAYSLCATSSAFSVTQSGLSLITDVASVPDDWAAAAAVVEAWREYAHVLEARGDQEILRDRSEAAQWFTHLTQKYLDVPERTFLPVPNRGGPRWQRSGLRQR
jgi:hypothetical protein